MAILHALLIAWFLLARTQLLSLSDQSVNLIKKNSAHGAQVSTLSNLTVLLSRIEYLKEGRKSMFRNVVLCTVEFVLFTVVLLP